MYLSPPNQARDLIVSKLVSPLYSPKCGERPLSPQILRQMTDEKLLDFVFDYYGFRHLPELDICNCMGFRPCYEKFLNPDRAMEFMEEVDNNSNYILLGKRQIKGFNTGVSYWVSDSGSSLLSFECYNPQAAERMRSYSEKVKGHYIHYIKNIKTDRSILISLENIK